MNHQIPRKRRLIEILMVVATGIGKIFVMDVFNLRLPFITTVIVFWASYYLYRTTKDKSLKKYWGLSILDSKDLFKIVAILGVIVILGIVIFGVYIKPIKWSVHVFFVLLVYPIWGLIQQFLVMSLFAGNIKDLSIKHIGDKLIIVFTSIMFSIVHYPSMNLMIATFIMALIYSTLFLRYRNIIPLGLFHGVIGGLFYYVILNRDAWVEFVTRYIS